MNSLLNVLSTPATSLNFCPKLKPAFLYAFSSLLLSPNQLKIFQKSSSAVYASCANFLTLESVLNNPLILFTLPSVAPKSTSFKSLWRSPNCTCELTTPNLNNFW